MNLYAKATIRTIRETSIRFLYTDLIMKDMREKRDERRISTIVNIYAKALKSMPVLPTLFSKVKSPSIIASTYKKIIGMTKNKAFSNK